MILAFMTCFKMNSLSLNAVLYASGSLVVVVIFVSSSSLSLYDPVGAVAVAGPGVG